MGPSVAPRTDLKNCKYGKLQLGKIPLPLGERPLGKYTTSRNIPFYIVRSAWFVFDLGDPPYSF